ncbi:hypothetical protein [Streptomyces sp. NPDC054787]
MRNALRYMATTTVAIAALSSVSLGSASADDGLLSGLLSPLVCGLQNNVNGDHNHVTQGGTCHQSSTSTPPANGAITGYERVFVGVFDLLPGERAIANGFCPAGKRALSGGAYPDGGGSTEGLRVNYSAPGADGSWPMEVTNEGPTRVAGSFYVICANVGS